MTLQPVAQCARTVAGNLARGALVISHSGFALLGLAVVVGGLTLTLRPDLRQISEARLSSWLAARQPTEDPGMDIEPTAIERATAMNPKDLPKQQAAVAYWLARKYKVAPEPLGALVAEAYQVGAAARLDPLLILSIMAVESSFNPFAQSPVGAQGLMQVMTTIHNDKYTHFGGRLAAFDPVTNLRVGVKVLQECIARAGSIEAGLKYYVGSALHETDGGYAGKVMTERARLQDVAAGRSVPLVHAQAASRQPASIGAVLRVTSPVDAVETPAPVAAPALPAPGQEAAKPADKVTDKLALAQS